MDLVTGLLIVLSLGVAWLAWRVARLGTQLTSGVENGSVQLLHRELESVRTGVDTWLRAHVRHTEEMSRRLGELQRAAADVEQLGAQLGALQGLLQPPQVRGALGERLLEDLVADVLPRQHYELQYTYPSTGARVDVAVLLDGNRILPIDAKFPLQNFRRYLDLQRARDPQAENARRAFARDVRRHVDTVAGKYLEPQDGAIDLAFMYIPSESVFHEINRWEPENGEPSLAAYALRSRVTPVSPNTLYAYLSVVRMGLKGFELQQSVRDVVEHLSHIRSDLEGTRSELGTAITQARHSLTHLVSVDRALRALQQRVETFGEPESRRR